MIHTKALQQLSGVVRGLVFAAGGYAVVMVAGWLASRSVESDGFADLGIAALTAVALAPAGALAGAIIAHHPYRHHRLGQRDRATIGWGAIAVAAGAAGTGWLIAVAPAVTVLLLGAAALVIARIGLAERSGAEVRSTTGGRA